MQTVATAIGSTGIIFKKIDSTLRGNVSAEILAALQAFGRETAVVTPAFPDLGRTVRDGCLYVDDKLCAQSIGLDLHDAIDNAGLDRIVACNFDHRDSILWAGSAGLAAALARILYGPPKPLIAPRIEGPLIFCIGSDHPATVAQAQTLTDHRILTIVRNRTTADQIRHALHGAGALFITGGDTASAVLTAIGAQGIAIQHQVVTGVPWGLLIGGAFDGRPVVTKSGGFGAPDTLLKVAEFFTS